VQCGLKLGTVAGYRWSVSAASGVFCCIRSKKFSDSDWKSFSHVFCVSCLCTTETAEKFAKNVVKTCDFPRL